MELILPMAYSLAPRLPALLVLAVCLAMALSKAGNGLPGAKWAAGGFGLLLSLSLLSPVFTILPQYLSRQEYISFPIMRLMGALNFTFSLAQAVGFGMLGYALFGGKDKNPAL